VVAERDLPLIHEGGVFAVQLEKARSAGARAALVAVGRAAALERLAEKGAARASEGLTVGLEVADTRFLLEPLTRIGAKMLLNALSTCTMVRLGRVLGNRMICLVPSNLKLIDRSTRYVRDLAGVSYDDACRALFEVIEHVEPRRRAGKAYPAPVGVATMRLRHGLSLPEAEERLARELA
jgi:N-acetylmuramic acid 6-phosphate (MurNAc-6-P) etherase